MYIKKSARLGEKDVIFEIGKMAKQADGSVLVSMGDTSVLCTVVLGSESEETLDFLPLTVDYIEKTSAAGKIPGGFFKREGKPTEREILNSRIIDRSIRPLFPKAFNREIQVITTVLSADPEYDPDIVALTGTSLALLISNAPYETPIAGLKIGYKDGNFLYNPRTSILQTSEMELTAALSKDALIMVEGGANIIEENIIVEGLFGAFEVVKEVISLQEEIRKEVGREKLTYISPCNLGIKDKLVDRYGEALKKILLISGKKRRNEEFRSFVDTVKQEILAEKIISEEDPVNIEGILEDIKRDLIREMIVKEGRRIDGRGVNDIRQISCEVGLFPRTHGSALFTRGETQALVVTTLGTAEDEQKIEALGEESSKRFMLHYNFPPFSTGEVKFLRAPSRREIGHGNLAERALSKVIPSEEKFPYTIRVLSDILESNGSSSMATVCGATLSLMDAGVPISDPVAGVAMGLIKEGEKVVVLTDILGDEDHCGDMDFKVAGTRKGVTSIQMDIKIKGISKEIMTNALEQAREARLKILDVMNETIASPRPDISPYAPRITTISIKPDKIRDVIGSGGKVIREIISKSGVIAIDIDDNGLVKIAANNQEAAQKAVAMIENLTQEVEVGKVYMGKVSKVVEFGAFVTLFPGTDGLVHISELSDTRVNKVTDVVREGEDILVKVIGIDKQGKIKLSRKEALNHHKKK
ncbi:MAG: polyribonucleotide nucleotidyltransferase [Deltaproteobacteria bacterium]|nr:polyribonucleotide nucleotidyltransferase [Deltaproteobacteria bacterium]